MYYLKSSWQAEHFGSSESFMGLKVVWISGYDSIVLKFIYIRNWWRIYKNLKNPIFSDNCIIKIWYVQNTNINIKKHHIYVVIWSSKKKWKFIILYYSNNEVNPNTNLRRLLLKNLTTAISGKNVLLDWFIRRRYIRHL
jgi:hypothetical protein